MAASGEHTGQDDAADTDTTPLNFGWGKRLPMIRQSEATECGLACLAMIAGYYGHHVDLATLRRQFTLSLKGITLDQMVEMGESLGLACRPLRLELDELARLDTPCILHWDLDHFVVLKRVTKRGVVIHDPAGGILHLKRADLGPHWTGVAVELSKGPNFKRKQPPSPVSLRKLAGSVRGLGKALAVVFSLALLLELISLAWPQFLQFVVDQVLADSDQNLLTLLGLSFMLMLGLQVTFTALRTWTVMWLGMHFNLSWTGNVFQHLMRLPQSYFLKRHLGDIVSRFQALSVIQEKLTTKFIEVILDGLMALITLSVMFIYSRLLTGIVALSMVIYAITRVLYYRAYFEANLSQIRMQARQQSVFMESARGVQTLRLHNQSAARTSRYLNATADSLNTSIGVQKLSLVFDAIQNLTTGAQRIGVMWLGAWLALGGSFSAGMLMAYVAYANQFASRAGGLVDYLVELKLLRLQGERLADIVMTAPEAHTDAQWAGPEPEPSIAFDNVSFRYGSNEPWVLRACSFDIEAGDSVAITGPSGGGKSTLVRVLLGLVDPQQGHIRIGGVDLHQLGKRSWRSMLGAVMQDDTLFRGTIADNISFHDENATPDKVEAAARQAEIHDDIIAMPMGYHTHVGDMGSTLSGGQRQRLLLARALFKQPRVLVLDEATSHLDAATEQRINRTLAAMSITRVVVAHRRETIQSAQKVLFCQEGVVHERRIGGAGEQTRGEHFVVTDSKAGWQRTQKQQGRKDHART